MRILRARDRTPKPWKNGGGITFDVAVAPPGAGLDDFDWRISFAEVASDGPFSSFEGIDRTLTFVRGKGVTLIAGEGEDAPAQNLTINSPPFSFPGEAPVVSRLTDGPILDLNVMTRRGGLTHRVARLEARPQALRPSAPAAFLAWLEGAVTLTRGASVETLGPLDLADLAGFETQIAPEPGARLALIEILTMRA